MGRQIVLAMVILGSLIVAGQVWLVSAMLSKPLPSGKTGWETVVGAKKKSWERRPDLPILVVGNVRATDGGGVLVGGARFTFDIHVNQCTGSIDPRVCSFCMCWDELPDPVPEVSAIVADDPMAWPVSTTETNVVPSLESHPNGRTLYVIAVGDDGKPVEYQTLLVKADVASPAGDTSQSSSDN